MKELAKIKKNEFLKGNTFAILFAKIKSLSKELIVVNTIQSKKIPKNPDKNVFHVFSPKAKDTKEEEIAISHQKGKYKCTT